MKKIPEEIVFPPDKNSWLSPPRVEYIRNLLSVLMYVFALPYLLRLLLTRPGGVVLGKVSPVHGG